MTLPSRPAASISSTRSRVSLVPPTRVSQRPISNETPVRLIISPHHQECGDERHHRVAEARERFPRREDPGEHQGHDDEKRGDVEADAPGGKEDSGNGEDAEDDGGLRGHGRSVLGELGSLAASHSIARCSSSS